jgi:ketosteroid isomerase-like protein
MPSNMSMPTVPIRVAGVALLEWLPARARLSALEAVRAVAEEYREVDAERVLALDHYIGHFKASGLAENQMRTEGAHLFRLRGDKVVQLTLYHDRHRALADVGLEE